MDLMLADKVALVTAASRGLGKAAALELSREGVRIAMASRSESIFEAAMHIQDETGNPVFAMQADLTKPGDIDSLVARTQSSYGKLDILVINAGGPPPGGFLDLTPEAWEQAIQLTIMSAVRLCYSAIPIMLEQGSGSIVATQSFSVRQPVENLILSNALRLAVIGLMKTLADEFGPQGIRVNSINPGWTKTGRVTQLLANRAEAHSSTPEEEEAAISDAIPLQRMASVEEYGRAIAWLASPAASYIHGHALMVDGGLTRATL